MTTGLILDTMISSGISDNMIRNGISETMNRSEISATINTSGMSDVYIRMGTTRGFDFISDCSRTIKISKRHSDTLKLIVKSAL